MQPAFDAYYRWLGIPPEEQPPDHYQLLGLRQFEADPDVIESAADRQMRHVQTFKTGQHSALSQSLLNEIAAARVCLLAPAKKAAYDAGLKAAIPPPPPMRVPVAASVPRALAVEEAAPPVPLINTERGNTVAGYRSKRSVASSGWTMLAVGIAAVGVFVGAAWLVWRSRPVAPQLAVVANQALDEGQTLSQNLAPADLPPRGSPLVFELLGGAPTGVKLDRATGQLTWTPEEAHGPGTHKIGVRASVSGSPHLFDETSFDVLVTEVHQPPQLEPIELRPAGRGALSARLSGKDLDLPRGKLTYTVQATPSPAAAPSLNPDNGQFLWRPASEDMGKSFQLTFRVTKAGMPPFFSEQTVKVDVTAVPEGAGFGRQQFAASLEAAGAAVQYSGAVVSAVFGGQRHSYRVDQKNVDVTEYASAAEAASAIAQLKPEASRFGGSRLTFTAPTHFFHKERLLVASGDDEALLQRLTAVLGPSLGVGRPAMPAATSDPNLVVTPPAPLPAPKPRLPAPDAQTQAKDLETIRKIYEERFKLKKPADRLELAKTLYAKALEMRDSPTERFAMFLESHELAVLAGDVGQAWQALEMLSAGYEFDPFDAKLAALKKVISAGRNNIAEHLEAAMCYCELIELAAQQERFDDALSLIQPGQSSATRAKDAPLAARIQKRRSDLADLKKAFEAAEAATLKLQDSPEDPLANQHRGSYLCLWRNRWNEGLRLLAKASSEKLAEAARLDVAGPTNAGEQRAAGDAWLAASEAARNLEREAMVSRAEYWYRLALPKLVGLDKVQVQKKVDSLPPRVGMTSLGKQPPAVQPPAVQPPAPANVVVPPVQNPVALPSPPPADDPNLDRLVAQTILKFPPSQVSGLSGQNRINVSREIDLPPGPIQLTGVVLVGPRVGDELMAWLRNLKNLASLHISTGTNVTDAGIAPIGGLDTLTSVQIHTEQLTDAALAHVAKLSRLQFLHLSNGRYTDVGVEQLAGLNNLTTLTLRNTECSDESFRRVARLPQLQSLTIGSNQIRGNGLTHLAELPRLRNLYLECPSLGDEHFDALAKLPNLQVLSLRGGFSDRAWSTLGHLTSLTSLTLDSPQLTCTGISEISKLTGLQIVVLRGSGPSVTDAALATIASLPQLRMLVVERGETLTNTGLASLAASTSLESMTIFQARQINDAGLAPIAKMPKLKSMQLHDAVQIGDPGLMHFQQASQLQALGLHGSRVSNEAVQALRASLPRCNIAK